MKKFGIFILLILIVWSSFWIGARYSYDKELACLIQSTQIDINLLERRLDSEKSENIRSMLDLKESNLLIYEELKTGNKFMEYIFAPIVGPLFYKDRWNFCQVKMSWLQ